MNVVIWARVSSREQKEGYSIDAQLRACRDRATKNGWTVLREFVVAESAKRGAERVVFNEMFRWVKANAKRERIKAILSHKLDRVCRNMRDAVRLQELEDACGVQLSFADNQFGPGAAGALSFNVMAAVAQYYSDNRRTDHHVHVFSGGIIRCAHCGYAVTGERIRRKLLDGGVREHVYYRCANNNKPDDHPPMRVREEDLLNMFTEEFGAFKMPPDIAEWFRMTIQTAFADIDELQRQRKQSMAKRKTELAGMQDRLLNGYLAGAIEQAAFQAKAVDLKREIGQVEESLERATLCDPDAPTRALALFDFSQRVADIWHGSNSEVKREILDCVSLNRTVSAVSLCLQKRKPFDVLAEWAFLKSGRGGRI